MRFTKKLALFVFLILPFALFCGCNKTIFPSTGSGSIPLTPINTPESSSGEEITHSSNKEKSRVLCLINGTLGDKGFYDNMASGVNRLHSELGWDARIIEMGKDETNYKNYFTTASESGEWDLIVTGTFSVKNLLQEIAVQFPNQKYIIIDVAIDFSQVPTKNIIGVTYANNEIGFLSGALAALMLEESGNNKIDATKPVLGFAGSINTTHINDFLVGYIEGIKYIAPEIKLLTSYVDSFSDVPKCLEITSELYKKGAQIIYAPTSQSIQGAVQASSDMDKLFIGCDNDIWTILKDTDPKLVENTLSSTIKNAGNSIFNIASGINNEIYNLGENYSLGVKDNAVGLADNENYQKLVPQSIREQISIISKKIISGEILVSSAFNMTPEEILYLSNGMIP